MTHPTAVEEWDCTLFIKQRLEQVIEVPHSVMYRLVIVN